jgi:tetratricopeptide (TPR) repeat protein
MRIGQARFFGPAMMVVAAASFAVSLGVAQRGGSTGAGGTPATSGKGTPATSTPAPSSATQTPTTASQAPRPIWITGSVTMYDGEPPPQAVTIERVCSANSVRAQGYTDSKGRFSFNLGQNSAIFADASTSGPGPSMSSNSGSAGGNSESSYWDCELRASLAGYRSSTVSLAGHRTMDTPDVGVIVLYPIAKIQGLIASATSVQAPKDARKAYEKGLDAVKKSKPDQAEQEFRKAVGLYPRYAAAWFELGKSLEQKERYPEAREAYASALAADSKYVYPYQQLYRLALREQNWKDLVEKTGQLLHLDPYEFPSAYYFNALGHLQLKEYDAAEKSAHQAVEADRNQENPKTHYLLGAILVQKQDWAAAAASLRAYLKAAPNASDRAQVEKTLVQIDQQISRMRPAAQDSPAQQ